MTLDKKIDFVWQTKCLELITSLPDEQSVKAFDFSLKAYKIMPSYKHRTNDPNYEQMMEEKYKLLYTVLDLKFVRGIQE